MANTLRIKRRSSSGAVGAPSGLENAELAFNEADNTLYYGTGTSGANGSATSVIAIGGYGAYTTLGTVQTITGNKTFSGTVVVPTPSASTHAATKAYVDSVTGALATSFSVAGNSGSAQTITSGTDTLSILGGVGLSSAATSDTITLNINNTAVTNGSYGAANSVGTFTVDPQGRLTAATNVAISITASQVSDRATNLVTGLTGTANEITVSNSGVGAVTLSLPSNVNVANNLVVGGNLTVNGTLTAINSTTLTVDDKNIELASTDSPTDASADGAGLTVKGATDKTWNWVNATDAWTASEHIDIANGKSYIIDGVTVLSSTTLGSGIVNSSLAALGTVVTGTWNAGTIAIAYGGTGATTASGARTNLGLAIGTDVQAYDSELAALSGLTSAADKLPYFTGASTAALADFTNFGRSLIAGIDAANTRVTLGLGTISVQSAANVAITGGSITNLSTFDGVVIDAGTF